jgi:hypothetical protein
MFHPFGMPALDGQVRVAKILDPYAGFKLGFSIITYDGDDIYRNKNDRVVGDFPVFNWWTAGLRWYFRENVSLWTESSIYDFTLGFSFKL